MFLYKHVFLSGPMTGVYLNNVARFAIMHAKVRKELGATRVYNPALEWLMEGPEEFHWHEYYMRKCLNTLTNGSWDCIVMLQGWENSEGAKTEKMVAEAIGLDVIYEDDLE